MEIDLKTEIRLMETNVELKISMVGRGEKIFLLIILKNSTITWFASNLNMKL